MSDSGFTDAEDKIICPTCAKELSPKETVWLFRGRWYCSETCVRKALKV